MLGQRLSQLEMEAKHKQEIADMRAEQVRMLSQLMLLTAGQNMAPATGPTRTNQEFIKQQQELMRNIQAALEIPLPKSSAPAPSALHRDFAPAAADPEDIPVGESIASKRSAAVMRQAAHLQQSNTKYSSIGESALVGAGLT